jgi:radical SAM superfamily enzyme YgiQ (UPF0313 family)
MTGRVTFVVPPRHGASVVADFGGGLGFEPLDEYVLPPLDLLQLAACAQEAGWDCQVVDALAYDLDVATTVDVVAGTCPDVVIINSTVPTLAADLAMAAAVSPLAARMLLRYRSAEPTEIRAALTGGVVDACLTDECEIGIGEILEGSATAGTARLVDGVVVPSPGPVVSSLDDLPRPARELVDGTRYRFPKLGIVATVQASRGCPYPCGYYCPYPLVQGRKWRARSAGSVGAELAELVEMGTTAVLFRDPVFTLDMKRAAAICEEIRQRDLSLAWWCETRADRLDAVLIEKMAAAGCRGINVGVESGDPALRFSTLKRGVTDELLIDLCASAARSGVAIAFLMMVGFPGETRSGVLRSGELIERCRPAHVGISYPVNHPGTRFADDAVANGWVGESARASASGSIPVVVADLPASDMIVAKRLLQELHQRVATTPAISKDEALAPLRVWAGATIG